MALQQAPSSAHLDIQTAMRAPILMILSISCRMLKSSECVGLSLRASFTCFSKCSKYAFWPVICNNRH